MYICIQVFDHYAYTYTEYQHLNAAPPACMMVIVVVKNQRIAFVNFIQIDSVEDRQSYFRIHYSSLAEWKYPLLNDKN